MSDQTVANPALDITAINPDEFPARDLVRITGKRAKHFQAVMSRRVLEEIHAHGQSVTDAEICGVLVGNVYHDKHGPYLHISASIRGDKAQGHAAQVTFTDETWTAIHETMDRDYTNARIVGWYHTHPGFGIFLSGMDLFIQDNFFNLPWQVAFVYDPIGGDEGMFFWRKGKSQREKILIEEPDIDEARGRDGHKWTLRKNRYDATSKPPTSMKSVLATAFILFFLSFVGMYVYLYLNPSGLDPLVDKWKQWRGSPTTQAVAAPTTAPAKVVATKKTHPTTKPVATTKQGRK
jgi:proteasome lid subunit RPN8/RPN11